MASQEETRRRLKKRRIGDVQVEGEDYPRVTERQQASRGTSEQQEFVRRLRENLSRDRVDAPQRRYKPGTNRARPMPAAKARPTDRPAPMPTTKGRTVDPASSAWARPKIDRTPDATEKVVRFPKATGQRRKTL